MEKGSAQGRFPHLILSVIGMIIMLGQGMLSPVLPLYGSSFGVSASAVGLLITSFGLARVLTDLPAGYFSERYGAARVLLLGPAITAVASLMAGLASSFSLLVLWRFWQGVGSALFTTAAMARIAEFSPPRAMARNLALFQGFHLLGTSFGPSLGGLAAQYGGYRLPFFFFAGLAASGVLATLAALRWGQGPERATVLGQADRMSTGQEEKTPVSSVEKNGGRFRAKSVLALSEDGNPQQRAPCNSGKTLRLLAHPPFVLVALVNFSIFFARAGGRQTIVPLFGANVLGLKESQIGFALTLVALGNLATIYLAGWLADRHGIKKVLVPSILLASFGFVLFALSENYPLYLLAAAVLGLGSGLGGPLPAAFAVFVGGNTGHSLVMGALRFFGDVGFMLGPVILGLVADVAGYRQALMVNAALMGGLVALFAFLAVEPSRRRRLE